MKLLTYISILLKYNLRNSTKEVPVGISILGRFGRVLISPVAEIILFFLLFCFINTVIIGFSIEEEFFSESFAINPFGLVLGMVLQFLLYDNYNRDYRSKMNLLFLKVIPFSHSKRSIYALVSEIISTKILILPSAFICLLFFRFSNLKQLSNISLTLLLAFLVLCSLSAVYNLLVIKAMKWISYGITAMFCLVILASYEIILKYFEKEQLLMIQLSLFALLVFTLLMLYFFIRSVWYRRAF